MPDGEICRAGLITGKIEMSKQAREDDRDTDYKTLLSFIERNRGWLSQLYLASGGGNIGMGLGLAEVTIKLHLRGVFRKIGARSRSEAAVIAAKANLA